MENNPASKQRTISALLNIMVASPHRNIRPSRSSFESFRRQQYAVYVTRRIALYKRDSQEGPASFLPYKASVGKKTYDLSVGKIERHSAFSGKHTGFGRNRNPVLPRCFHCSLPSIGH